jgi:glycoside/pentoside/hexuronide:cation symporter, GPH family
MTYFYLPPETAEAAFPELISSKTFMGLTVIGIAGFIGSIMPIFIEPSIASWSDRSKSRFGRRRIFMIFSFLPYAVLAYAIFVLPTDGVSALNTAWVLVMIILFNLMRAAYGIPFGALMTELGTSNKLIMLFSTMNSLGWAIGFIFGSQLVYVIKDSFYSTGMSAMEAFRITVGGLAALSALLMIAPILVVDEKRYCQGKVSKVNMMASLKKAFTNKTFVLFQLADLTYGLGDMLFQMGLIYFVTILLDIPESMVLTLGVALIALSFCQYPFINMATKRIGKKTIYTFGLIIMIFSLFLIAAVDLMPLPSSIMVWIVIVVASIPSAITGIIPGSIAAEIIREDSVRTGNPSEATYGAAASLIRKFPAGMKMPSWEYGEYCFNKFKEIIDCYKPDVLFNDIGYPVRGMLKQPLAHYCNTVPGAVINNRWMQWRIPETRTPSSGPSVQAGLRGPDLKLGLGNYATPEFLTIDHIPPFKWECSRGLGSSFGYNRMEDEDTLFWHGSRPQRIYLFPVIYQYHYRKTSLSAEFSQSRFSLHPD